MKAPFIRGRSTERIRALPRVASRELEEKVAVARASGVDVLSLSGGPSLELPAHVKRAAQEATDQPMVQMSRGSGALRAAIRDLLAGEAGLELDAETNILVTNGAMHALDVVFRTLLDGGDNVVIPAPNFFFGGLVQLVGGEARYVIGQPAEAFGWDLDALEQAIDERTKAIVFSNPTNPTGYLPSSAMIAQLGELARRHDLVVIADESYDRLVYGERPFVAALSTPGWAERFVLVRSLSKSFALAPWRIGYVVAEESLVDQFMKVAEWEILYTSHVGQAVATAAISGTDEWLADVVASYRDHRDLVWQALASCAWLDGSLPPAGPFFFPDVSALTAEGLDPVEQLLRVGIPTVPGDSFGDPSRIRLPFGGSRADIAKLSDRISTFAPRA